jgi:hypothetical protein
MSGWYIDDIRIVTQTWDSDDQQHISRLSPVGGGTVHHFFGYDDAILKMVGLVVGHTDADAIKLLAKTGSAYTVSGWGRGEGDYYVKSAKVSRVLGVWKQTFLVDGSHASTDPVYNIELELYKNES